jgi:hypothetical protein
VAVNCIPQGVCVGKYANVIQGRVKCERKEEEKRKKEKIRKNGS